MAFLLLYLGDNEKFDVQSLRQGLLASKRVKQIAATDEYAFSCEYRTPADVVEVSIKGGASAVIVDGMGEAAFAAALDVQRFTSQPVHVVDESYTFDMKLDKFGSPADLERAIKEAGG